RCLAIAQRNAEVRKGNEPKTVSHQLGLLINFAEEHLKNGIRRTANNLYDHPFAYLRVPLREAKYSFWRGLPCGFVFIVRVFYVKEVDLSRHSIVPQSLKISLWCQS